MKTIILLLFFVHLTVTAFCQTVTIIDLKKIARGEDADKTLTAKSYKMIEIKGPHKKKQTFYVANYRSPIAESIQIGQNTASIDGTILRDVTYMTRDTNYVNRIMKQVKMSGLTLIDKKIQKNQIAYSFDSRKLFVQVILKNPTTLQSTVQVHPK
jgi:hypothetical protein